MMIQQSLTFGQNGSLIPTESKGENLVDVLRPFQLGDSQKGTFLLLRVAGINEIEALRQINRKRRSIENWISIDPDFKRLYYQLDELHPQYSNQAKILRAAVLDAYIIDTGIKVFREIMNGEKVSDGAWQYANTMAKLRIPVMFDLDGGKGENSYTRLARIMQENPRQQSGVTETTFSAENKDGQKVTVKVKKENDGKEIMDGAKSLADSVVKMALESINVHTIKETIDIGVSPSNIMAE